MDKNKKMTDEELATAHWIYIRSVLMQQIEVAGKMYIDAFIHGYKHGANKKED